LLKELSLYVYTTHIYLRYFADANIYNFADANIYCKQALAYDYKNQNINTKNHKGAYKTFPMKTSHSWS
jgi:hypothetical protein